MTAVEDKIAHSDSWANGLVLSLFPGIGLLDQAFEEEGFCVVRGPDLLWGGQVKRFHIQAGWFSGIIGGPPCQEHTTLAQINRDRGVASRHGDQNPEFDRLIEEGRPDWFVRENAPRSAPAAPRGYHVHSQMLRDVWCGGETTRLRRICFGSAGAHQLIIPTLALHRPDAERAVTGDARMASVSARARERRKGRSGADKQLPLEEMLRLQGLPEDFFGADCPFTTKAKRQMIGNGVPLPMGRAVARAVKAALQQNREAA